MNRKRTLNTLLLAIAMLCLAGAGSAVAADSGSSNDMTRTVDGYTINLKLLPAEPFVAKSKAKVPDNAGAMVNGSGAMPMKKGGPGNPNHHLVVFISRNGKPVEHAHVKMSYRMKGSSKWSMTKLPVTRMWVAGHGEKTTHYGNNVHLDPGMYQVQVTVNGKAKADFHLSAK